MGIYWEYIDKKMSFDDITKERKRMLEKISSIRGRDIIVYTADFSKGRAPISLSYDDLVPFYDQLSNLNNNKVDIILETPGGSGEVAEDIVKTLRNKFEDIAVIIPGWAKSAGTIISMACDDILMDSTSALGPIDAQISWQGKTFSADALIKGFEKIKSEVDEKQRLNQAYIPILQGISPGELESAQNSLDFAIDLVTDWLVTYKFKDWNIHSKTGEEVRDEEKIARAQEIAAELCNNEKWKTHGRSLRINDLEELKLKITNYEEQEELNDAIKRYNALMRMTFDSNIYKMIETINSQIYRFFNENINSAPIPQKNDSHEHIFVDLKCKCGYTNKIQVNFKSKQQPEKGYKLINDDGTVECENCSNQMDVTRMIREIESQTKKKVIL
ncbi:SDH family Clp fold serine proteinase [Piscibacillus sp. B03]|uniref:SDH family Clp fold serine proteinase n=1 Tax=Piscibacillus sp. B03 TaxID=3457430 RepID=UPI003FCD9CDC